MKTRTCNTDLGSFEWLEFSNLEVVSAQTRICRTIGNLSERWDVQQFNTFFGIFTTVSTLCRYCRARSLLRIFVLCRRIFVLVAAIWTRRCETRISSASWIVYFAAMINSAWVQQFYDFRFNIRCGEILLKEKTWSEILNPLKILFSSRIGFSSKRRTLGQWNRTFTAQFVDFMLETKNPSKTMRFEWKFELFWKCFT